jgi:hypothetical protein
MTTNPLTSQEVKADAPATAQPTVTVDAGAKPAETVAAEGTKTALTTEAPKTEGEAKPAEGAKKEEAPAKVVPETYADFAMVEGVKLNETTMKEFHALAKEAGMTQEQAQKFVNMGANMTKAHMDKAGAEIAEVRKQWAEQAKTDKEFGGDNLNANLAVAQRGLKAFDTKDGKLNTMLKETGLGDHPEIIRLFHKIGLTVKEDSHVSATGSSNARSGAAEVLFGQTHKK